MFRCRGVRASPAQWPASIRQCTRRACPCRCTGLLSFSIKAADNSPWIEALAELKQRAAREGHCYLHVQAITVAIDQYAEKALSNRDYFLNKPYGVG